MRTHEFMSTNYRHAALPVAAGHLDLLAEVVARLPEERERGVGYDPLLRRRLPLRLCPSAACVERASPSRE